MLFWHIGVLRLVWLYELFKLLIFAFNWKKWQVTWLFFLFCHRLTVLFFFHLLVRLVNLAFEFALINDVSPCYFDFIDTSKHIHMFSVNLLQSLLFQFCSCSCVDWKFSSWNSDLKIGVNLLEDLLEWGYLCGWPELVLYVTLHGILPAPINLFWFISWEIWNVHNF